MEYPRSSRYFGVPTALAEGGVPYLRRRLLPAEAGLITIGEHVTGAGDRLDLIGFRQYGDAEQWWRVADANPVLDPAELTAEPGRRLRITVHG